MAKQYARVPLKIASIYAVIGCLWILFSDRAVGLFTRDPEMFTRISITKGWVYVLLTALLLYWLIHRHVVAAMLSEEKLKASEEKFASAFNHSPVLMSISTIADGRYLEVNEMFCQVTGFSRQETIGRTSVELGWISAADRERLLSVLQRDGRVVDLEIDLTAKDGRMVTCLCSGELITVEGQQHLLSIALDITENKKNLAALDYVNECFTQALTGPRHVLYRLNVARGGYDYMSPAFENITGYRVEEFKNTNLERLKEYFHPDDRLTVFSLLDAAFRNRVGKTVAFDLEYRLKKADGDYCWLHDYTTACFNDNGELECFFGSAYDITQSKKAKDLLQQSEERYRRFSSLTSDYVYSCRRSGDEPFRTQWLAGAIDEITGHSLEEIMAWGCWMPLVHPEDLQRVSRRLLSLVPGSGSADEFRIVRKDGAIRWIREACSCEPGEEPGELLLFGTSQDITDRKLAETAVIELNEHLERLVAERTAELLRSNEDLASFSYAVSHEIRAPIARLLGFSTMLGEICKGEGEAAFIATRIANASKQLQAVVDSILRLSRLAKIELSLQPVDLSELVTRKMHLLLSESPERQVELVVKPGVKVTADPNLLAICMDNLLSNALKYTGQTPQPRIEFGAFDEAGRNVCFVRDNGAGFDMSYEEKLYEPFERLHLHKEFPGMGIGLATVKRIIERHGGEIWADSRVGEGATFYFTLGGTS